jgi:NAD(P)-dependent dehydrogenase (short-subunit alcohol dehydrogenase family)
MELTGKTAIVTGAGQGIGRGIALVLAERGASVVLNGRTPAKLAAVKKEIDAACGQCVVAAGDVGSRSDVASVVEAALGAFGSIDILINNAQASTPDVSVLGVTDADLELTFRSGALGTLYTMQACHPHMKARGGGSIVNFGSSVAVNGDTGFAAYIMAKEAIRGLSRIAAREWGPDGIRVNVICPAAMSPSAAAFAEQSPERFRRVLRGIPAGRFGDPLTDIGRAVAGLVSDDFSYLTGATLMLDGGRTLIS